MLPPGDSVALTEAGQSLVDHVGSDLDKSCKKKRKPSPEVLKANRAAKRSLDHAMGKTLLQSCPDKIVNTQSPGMSSTRSPATTPQIGSKSGRDDDYKDEWTQLFHKRNHPVTREEMQKSSFMKASCNFQSFIAQTTKILAIWIVGNLLF